MKNKSILKKRLKRERITIEKMIQLYCSVKHGINEGLCVDCSALLKYSEARLLNCPFGYDKPVCSKCTVHCYSHVMRDKVKSVMRFSGPRMFLKYPYLAVMHLIDEKIYKPLISRSNAE